jgi:hypothetical protein
MKKIFYSLIGLALLMASCETIEDRESAGPVPTSAQLNVTVIQPTAGSNTIILNNQTEGAIVYYDWGTGSLTSRQQYDTIYIPFASTIKVKYTGFFGGGTAIDSTNVTVAENDEAYFTTDRAWYVLTNGGPGQTWVWALDIPGGIIGGNGPTDCPAPAWWTMDASAGNSWLKYNDKITFNLNGAANAIYTAEDGSVKNGFFKVMAPYSVGDSTFSAIQTLNGVTFPWPNTGKYHFTVMTADKLSVHEYAQYNIGMFKREGYNY